MSAIRHSGQGLAVGVDLGGTWVRIAAARPSGRGVEWREAAPRPAQLDKVFRTMWRRRGWRRDDVAALVVASRGVWTSRERAALARRLRPLARRVRVLSDAEAALLGALDGGPGLLVVAGTGSIVLGRDARGRVRRAGGLGPLIGDEGSAFWLGREWVRATARGDDVAAWRGLARSPDAVARIAALAPAVLRRARAGDRTARAIAAGAQARLAADARDVARRLALGEPVTVSWAGAVMGDAWFRAGVRRALGRARLRARWRPPAESPVRAALRIAAALAEGREPGP